MMSAIGIPYSAILLLSHLNYLLHYSWKLNTIVLLCLLVLISADVWLVMREFRLGWLFVVVSLVLISIYIHSLSIKLDELVVRISEKVQFPVINVNNNNDVVVVYNRVPKTGSTSFVGVAYDLCKKNKFHVLHVNISSNNHVLSLPNQYKLAENVTDWSKMKPALYHGHFAFVDFSKFGYKQPLYINIIRKPLDRLVSYYYFLRYGDNYRPYLSRRKHGDTVTFDECVAKDQPDCNPNNMWLQIPFFCGHAANCWKPGNKWALAEAKKNLINNYLLVGVTEELDDFIYLLEETIPRIFHGAKDYFLNSNNSHLRRTVQKLNPSEETMRKIQNHEVWKMENDLYEFTLEQFHFVKKHADKMQKFMYEKVRPK